MGIFGDIGSIAGFDGSRAFDDENRRYADELMKQAGALDPNGLKSEFAGISTDPALRAKQMAALSQLSDISNSGGMDDIAKSQLFEANRDAAGYEKSQRDAIQQNMAARGMGNSGASISALLGAQQAGANREAMGGVQAAAEARRRGMQALGQMADLSGNIRNQDYNEASGRARALDEMARARYSGQLGKIGALNNAYNFASGQNNKSAEDWRGLTKGIGDLGDDTAGSMMKFGGGF